MTISFVSSGPGNPDLLTVLAVKRISDADIFSMMIYPPAKY